MAEEGKIFAGTLILVSARIDSSHPSQWALFWLPGVGRGEGGGERGDTPSALAVSKPRIKVSTSCKQRVLPAIPKRFNKPII